MKLGEPDEQLNPKQKVFEAVAPVRNFECIQCIIYFVGP
jgi:hypothetical protein